MKFKQLLALAGGVLLVAVALLTVQAARGDMPARAGGLDYSFMWDENEQYLDRAAVELFLNEAALNGQIAATEIADYLALYDTCYETSCGVGGLAALGGGGG